MDLSIACALLCDELRRYKDRRFRLPPNRMTQDKLRWFDEMSGKHGEEVAINLFDLAQDMHAGTVINLHHEGPLTMNNQVTDSPGAAVGNVNSTIVIQDVSTFIQNIEEHKVDPELQKALIDGRNILDKLELANMPPGSRLVLLVLTKTSQMKRLSLILNLEISKKYGKASNGLLVNVNHSLNLPSVY
jgi:hypothetical protein